MISMYDLDEPTKILIEEKKKIIQETRVLCILTLVDLVGVVYVIFHEERGDLCWRNKDPRRRCRRTGPIYLEPFYRVLPLLVDTGGRLLPPCEKSLSSSNGF